MKGCYCIITKLEKTQEIKIGKKFRKIQFESGYYVYVGSAMNSLESRLKRHLSHEKKLHWHIDYFLIKAQIVAIIYNENKRVECELSEKLSLKAKGIEDFGCSDCMCESHLYYFKNRNEAIEHVQNAYDSIAIDYDFFNI